MYNFLVQFHPFALGRETMPLGRMFEYTDEALQQRFSEDGNPTLARLLEYPCLFMPEGTVEGAARVGTITRARMVERNVAFEYVADPEVPPIPNA